MARVTVEDCVIRVPNRFELVLLAVQRARDLSAGASLTVERENDKNPVIALREIAEETIEVDDLRQALVTGLQKHVESEKTQDDTMTILAAAEKDWAGVTGEQRLDGAGDKQAAAREWVFGRADETDAAPAGDDDISGVEDAELDAPAGDDSAESSETDGS